jgi:hypothetical protein
MLIALITYAFFSYALMAAAFIKLPKTSLHLILLLTAPISVWPVIVKLAKWKAGRV